ncbi:MULTISPECIES: hypothetical protein [Bacillus cereus group]|uniref:hypothetical protein n=1 Tax=Bacillus cereus group TaxID=86661 RepID=UPI000BFDF937|nr:MULTISPECIES: hypothetical protein [Bacillus cereus group]MCU7679000.1 hypothetical protein [Bacillus thuringiensis]PHG61175.1 hypothetical protein COI59_22695 [Bacillus toyonensis]QQN81584.1 hypothetical protein I0K03_15100 [Bacillus toyonensis]
MRQTRFLFVLIIFILGACSNDKWFTLKGESENWKGTYQGYTYDENNEASELTLIYKGDPSEIKGNIEYKYETDGSRKWDGNVLLDQNSIKTKIICEGCIITNKNDVIKITMSWNDKTETFKLQSKK